MIAFVGTVATTLIQLNPHDPESKRIVERVNQFLEASFMPSRTFRLPEDFNTQLANWLAVVNSRVVRRIGVRPIDLVSVDTAAMLSLPPVPPFTVARSRIRLPRDSYVRVHGNDHSVDPSAIGHLVEVAADLRQVAVTREGRVLAEHERRWSRGLTVSDPLHVESAARWREQFQNPTPATVDQDRMMRDLGDFDRAFGVEFLVEQHLLTRRCSNGKRGSTQGRRTLRPEIESATYSGIGSTTSGASPQRRMEPRGLSRRHLVERRQGEGIVRNSNQDPISWTSDTKIIGGV